MPQERPLSLNRKYAELIFAGKKTIEVRLSSRYTRAILPGDTIVFDVRESKLAADVISVHEYPRLSDLLHNLGPAALGFETLDEALQTYRRIYPYNADDCRSWRAFTLAHPRWLPPG